jgi:hypothetical protein
MEGFYPRGGFETMSQTMNACGQSRPRADRAKCNAFSVTRSLLAALEIVNGICRGTSY